MEWEKAKNLLMCVLIFANVFLAVNLATLLEKRTSEQSEKASLAVENLEQRGHTADGEAVDALPEKLAVISMGRDSAKEQKAAEGLLGECQKSVRGGGIEEYSSDAGKLTFRSGGNVSGEIVGARFGDDPLKDARNIFKAMGIEVDEISQTEDQVVGKYRIDGFEAENLEITVSQTTRGLSVEGMAVFLKNAQKSEFYPDYARALINLACRAEEEGSVLNAQDMDIIYYREMSEGESYRFYPVLLIKSGGQETAVSLQNGEILKNK